MRDTTSQARQPAYLLLALLLATVLAAPGAAQSSAAPPSADSVLRDFQPIGDYILVVDGREVPSAEIYRSERAPGFLVIASPTLPSPVLLSPRSMTAETVSIMKVAKRPDGIVDLLADAALAPQGQVTIDEDTVLFNADGHRSSLKPKPPLLGLQQVHEVTRHNPEYLIGARNYYPNGDAIQALKKQQRAVTVRIFYGSWCPHCRMMVPHALKVEEQLKGSKIHFEYFGLPPRFGNDPTAVKMNIKAVPTGVIYVDGREVGRIVENDWQSPEKTISSVLARG